MRNIIIPSRIPTRRARHTFHSPPTFVSPVHYTYISRRLLSSILPLDLSRTTTRLALHLPSIYFLCKMLLVWCLLILQTCQLLPSFDDAQKSAYWGIFGYVESLFVWNSKKDMSDICWATFCSVCAALLVEGLMKALDGVGGTLPIGNVNSNTSPFNLVCLHTGSFVMIFDAMARLDMPSCYMPIHFLPHIHINRRLRALHVPTSMPSSPLLFLSCRCVYYTHHENIIKYTCFTFFKLTIFHILSVSKRYSRHRLIPTALTSLFSLVHFHGTLFLHFFGSSSALTPTPTNPLSRLKSTPYLGGSKFTYPFLNYVPNIFETILIGTILLTITLNALVQLLVRGRVVRLFSGLGSGVNSQGKPLPPNLRPALIILVL